MQVHVQHGGSAEWSVHRRNPQDIKLRISYARGVSRKPRARTYRSDVSCSRAENIGESTACRCTCNTVAAQSFVTAFPSTTASAVGCWPLLKELPREGRSPSTQRKKEKGEDCSSPNWAGTITSKLPQSKRERGEKRRRRSSRVGNGTGRDVKKLMFPDERVRLVEYSCFGLRR